MSVERREQWIYQLRCEFTKVTHPLQVHMFLIAAEFARDRMKWIVVNAFLTGPWLRKLFAFFPRFGNASRALHEQRTLTVWNTFVALLFSGVVQHAYAGAGPRELRFPPSPRLATTPAELARIKASLDFQAKRQAAVKKADALVAHPVPLPEAYGSWIFYYACPDDGAFLKMITHDEHECPKCKRRFSDERTVAAWRCQMHHNLEHASLDLAWAYAYTGEEEYAEEVRRILLHLADQYETYPSRLDRWGRRGIFAPLGGRRYVQSLDEAVGVIRLAKAYDLTRDAPIWNDEERQHVERDFFRATSETLLTFNQGINNHQTWYNAGLMAIASVLADEKLVEKVLSMRGGVRDQLERSLGDDGLWYEGTMAYQNYALQAMVEIVDAGRRLGLQLHNEPRFKKLLTSSLQVAYPDGSYPAINDSDPGSFASFRWSYDWAWQTYREPRFAQAAAWGNPKKLAELLGPEAKPAWPLETRSLDLPDIGLVVLRAGQGQNQTCVFFDYGRHGGGHGHYDKLNITLFASGREWLLDTGRIGYTHKEYKSWVKHTVAHNTVAIDQSNQRPTTGRLLWLKTNPDWSACAGECATAYAGVRMQRYLLLTPKMLVDVFRVQSDREVVMDWLAHAISEPVKPVADLESTAAKSIGTGPGYEHLANAKKWNAVGPTRWDFASGNKRLRLWLDTDLKDQLFTAIAIGNYANQKAPVLLRRQPSSREACFITVFDLADGQAVSRVETSPQELMLSVRVDGVTHNVTFSESSIDFR